MRCDPRSFAALPVVVAAVASQGAMAQDAVQWTKSQGGNGHWYQGVSGYKNWQSAQNAALAVGGHLATANTEAENMFIMQVRDTQVNFGGAWIGLYQDSNGAEPGGGWMWVTGEPLDYTNWSSNEPNNTDNEGNDSDYAEMCCDGPNWGDWGGNRLLPSIIEWSADCNNDGIVDYGQILNGTVSDVNQNGIPDSCESGGGEDDDSVPGDFDGDGDLDLEDLAAIREELGICAADINADGVVDGVDLAHVLGWWGVCGTP